MTFIDHFTCITKICTIAISTIKTSLCFSKYQYKSETLMQKNNVGIIDNDVRIK